MSESLTQVEKIEMMDTVRSVSILCLKYKVIWEVIKENIAIEMWVRLE